MRPTAGLVLVLAACEPVPAPAPPPDLRWGDPIPCASPYAGFDRLVEATAERGLAEGIVPEVTGDSMQGGVLLHDLDLDGDLDIAIGRPGERPVPGPLGSPFRGFPRIYENLGGAWFAEVPQPERRAEPGGSGTSWLAADLDDDALPDILVVGEGWSGWASNQGDLTWGPLTLLPNVPGGVPRINAAAAGDLDGDGDLEVILPTLQVAEPGPAPGDPSAPLPRALPHAILQRGESGYTLAATLDPYDDDSFSQLAVPTDRDSDGDLDLFVLSEYGGLPGAAPSAFYRNDGDFTAMVNDAPAISADVWIGGMGFDSADLNGDDRLDYCIAQFGPMLCLLSDADGYYDAAAALGVALSDEPTTGPETWSGYSLELADLDLDGDVDLAAVAGSPAAAADQRQVDRLYENVDGRFVERGAQTGFADATPHFGMATGDLDGDGALDLLIGTPAGDPKLYLNRCAPGAFILLDLAGPPGNRAGLGVQVRVEAGGRRWLHELYPQRTLGQGPAELHFGLGDAEQVDRLEVRWPDGTTQDWADLPSRRRITAVHPDAP